MNSTFLAIISGLAFMFCFASTRVAEGLPTQYYWKCKACMGSCKRVQDGAIDCYLDMNGWCWEGGTCYSFDPE